MTRARTAFVGWALVAGCARAPAPLDVSALIARQGPVAARRELAIRVIEDPRDVQARLALAALAEQLGRPGEAIEQLEAVERLGGPIGVRWHGADRARLARLLRARARVRIARGAASALADLERAEVLGAPSRPDERLAARAALAAALARHVDAEQRARARALFADLARSGLPGASAGSWRGAAPGASPAERGAFGAWLWTIGARREAYEQLEAWHRATGAPRDERLVAAYLRARAWWSPPWLGAAAPPADALVGPERCWFPEAGCEPAPAEPAPLPPVGEAIVDPQVAAVARHASIRVASALSTAALAPIAAAFRRDPRIADRLGREMVAAATDAAVAHAALGALFDALGDPARARAAWSEAVTASAEPAFQRGLAVATARGGDGSAALVFAIAAAAASGDPAVVWRAVGAALSGAGRHVDALTAARNALDLAGPEEVERALDLAIEASRALGRDGQVAALQQQRARVWPPGVGRDPELEAALAAHRERPTADTIERLWGVSRGTPRDVDARATLLGALDRDDPRRPVIERELVELAGAVDAELACEAAAALRP